MYLTLALCKEEADLLEHGHIICVPPLRRQASNGRTRRDIVHCVVNTDEMPANIVVSRHINASPEKVWALVTDLPRMGEWSPENDGGSWTGGASAAAVGAKFKGLNSNGKKKWSTMSKVTVLEAPRSFAFDVSVLGLAIAGWSYEIEAQDGGTIVTETWIDKRGKVAMLVGGPASGVKDRESHNRAGMEKTLEGLAAAAES